MHSGGIGNDLELQRNRWKQCTSKAYVVTVLETIFKTALRKTVHVLT